MASSNGAAELAVEEPSTFPGESSERLFHDAPAHSLPPLQELQSRPASADSAQPHNEEPAHSSSPVPGPSRLAEEEESGPSPLTLGPKHVFVLSDAGKPIYARHGREEEFVVEMGVLQSLLSTVVDRGEALESFRFRRWTFVFLERSPLLLVAASRDGESEAQLRRELSLVHGQILSVLTASQLERIFAERRNFDLRRLLSGTERSLTALSEAAGREAGVVLGAVAPLPLPPQLRDALSAALHGVVAKLPNLVFALIVGGGELVTLVRLRKYSLSPADLHLLLNLVRLNAAAFRVAESWLPLCLPRFDSSGFLHAHVSLLSAQGPDDASPSAQSSLFLLFLTVDRNAFFALSEARRKLLDKLAKWSKPANILGSLAQAAELPNQGVKLSEVGLPGSVLWHFHYKNRSSGQMCSAAWEAPYVAAEEQRRLQAEYLRLVDKVSQTHTPAASPAKEGGPAEPSQARDASFRILFKVTEKEALLAWLTGNFELYAALSPLVTKSAAISRVDKLMKWLKREEDRLFILNPLVF